jgi:hypothetical protein
MSAHAPDGTSSKNDVTDQITNSDEIAVAVMPCSLNSRA